MKRIPIATVITAVALIVILVIYMVTYQVRFSETAVKVRLGKPQAVVKEPGLKFKWPAPIDTVQKYDMRWQTLDTPETETKTSDGQNVIIGCFAVWRVSDPLLFYKSIPDERDAPKYLRARINAARKTIIGQHNWSEFVNLDSDLVRERWVKIEQEMLDDAAARVMDEYGVELKRVAIRRISLPEETTAKVLEAMKSERNSLAAKYREEGKSLAEAIKAEARQRADQIMAFADRKASETEAAGQRASVRFYERIQAGDEEFFIWLRWVDAVEAALKSKTTIFMDAETEIFKRFAAPPAELMAGHTDAREQAALRNSRAAGASMPGAPAPSGDDMNAAAEEPAVETTDASTDSESQPE